MTDRPDTSGPRDHDASSADELTPDQLAELVGRLGDVDGPDPARRAAHLTAALAAFDTMGVEAAPEPIAPVVAMTDRRRDRARRMQRLAVAAAVLLVVGFGAVVAVGTSGDGDEMATSAADSAASGGDTRDAASTQQEMADLDGADAAAAAATEAPAPVGAPGPVLLGEFPDDAALGDALAESTLGFDASKTAPPTATRSEADTEAGAADSPATTLAASSAGGAAPESAACPDTITANTAVVATATVAGRPVVVISSGSPDPSRYTVVDLTDCSSRTL